MHNNLREDKSINKGFPGGGREIRITAIANII